MSAERGASQAMEPSGPSTPPVTLGPRFEEAFQLALALHRDDLRKGKNIPVVAHLLGVCALVLKDGGTEDEAIAALLHDTLEDHPEDITPEEIEQRFGADVLRIVRSCTDTPHDYSGGEKPPWRDRKNAYLGHLASAAAKARRVSLADKVDNARDTLADLRRDGEATWNRFNADREDQLWYYRSILEQMRAAGQTGHLLDEYARIVEALEAE